MDAFFGGERCERSLAILEERILSNSASQIKEEAIEEEIVEDVEDEHEEDVDEVLKDDTKEDEVENEIEEIIVPTPKPMVYVSGWLSFLLWGHIALGCVAILGLSFGEWETGSKDIGLALLLFLSPLLYLGIRSMVTFYHEKSNAVAVVLRYLWMQLWLLLVMYGVNLYHCDSSTTIFYLPLIGLNVLWITFVHHSETVEQLCSKETRTTKLPERLSAISFSVLVALLGLLLL